MGDRVEGRTAVRAVAGALLIAASLMLGARLYAQADAGTQSADHAADLAQILDRHANVDAATRKMGAAAFQANCAACHAHNVDRAPPVSMLGNLPPEAILRVITEGQMRVQAASLSDKQKQTVAEFLSGHRLGEMAAAAKPRMCAADPAWFDFSQPPAFEGWGLDSANAHSIPADVAGLTRANVGKLKLKWALAFPGVLYARSQPAIAGGAIFVGGDNGKVYALDPDTGCAHWTYTASGPVRQGIVVENWKAGNKKAKPLLFFGDLLGKEYALDAQSGRVVWQHKMDSHPNATLTGSPALKDGVLYVPVSSLEEPAAAVPEYECCTFRGSVVALDADSGKQKWRAYMVGEPKKTKKNENGVQQWGPSGAAIWSTPLVDTERGEVFVTTGDNYSEPATPMSDSIVAIDLKTGIIRWSHQASIDDIWNVSCGWAGDNMGNCPDKPGPDHDFGAAPIMAKGKDGRDYLIAGQKSGAVIALDPNSGEVEWIQRVGRGGVLGGVHFGISASKGRLFVPVSDFPDGGKHVLPARPGIYALDVATGNYDWSAPSANVCNGKKFCEPGYGAPISVTPDLVLAGSTDGHMRILDAGTGELLWDRDTDRAYQTVNGTMAHGGSMSGGAAPIAWHGKLIVESGYGGLGKMPGNVMLVFGTK